jgi:hypothetical protein
MDLLLLSIAATAVWAVVAFVVTWAAITLAAREDRKVELLRIWERRR